MGINLAEYHYRYTKEVREDDKIIKEIRRVQTVLEERKEDVSKLLSMVETNSKYYRVLNDPLFWFSENLLTNVLDAIKKGDSEAALDDADTALKQREEQILQTYKTITKEESDGTAGGSREWIIQVGNPYLYSAWKRLYERINNEESLSFHPFIINRDDFHSRYRE